MLRDVSVCFMTQLKGIPNLITQHDLRRRSWLRIGLRKSWTEILLILPRPFYPPFRFVMILALFFVVVVKTSDLTAHL